jgi:hypothetical protein
LFELGLSEFPGELLADERSDLLLSLARIAKTMRKDAKFAAMVKAIALEILYGCNL